MTLRTSKRHGICWACRRRYTLISEGVIRRHKVDRGTYCEGGNCLPLNGVVMGGRANRVPATVRREVE